MASKPVILDYYSYDLSGCGKRTSALRYLTGEQGNVNFYMDKAIVKDIYYTEQETVTQDELITRYLDSEKTIGRDALLAVMKKNVTHKVLYLSENQELVENQSVKDINDTTFVTDKFTIKRFGTQNNKQNRNYELYLINGIIYCFQVMTYETNNMDGYNFESYMLSKNPSTKPTPELANCPETLYGLFEMKINNNTILYTGHIDCAMPIETDKYNILMNSSDKEAVLKILRDAELVLCKLRTRNPENYTPLENDPRFRKSFSSYWWHCLLGGMKSVVVGFRHENVVTDVKKYNLEELEDMAKLSSPAFVPAARLKKTDKILNYIKNLFIKKVKNIQIHKYGNDIRNLPIVHMNLTIEAPYDSENLIFSRQTVVETRHPNFSSMVYLYMVLKDKTIKETIDEIIQL